jgi:hypothetical protein
MLLRRDRDYARFVNTVSMPDCRGRQHSDIKHQIEYGLPPYNATAKKQTVAASALGPIADFGCGAMPLAIGRRAL